MATLTLFPPEARTRPKAFVPGDDGTVIRAHDARTIHRDAPNVAGPPAASATTQPAGAAVGGQTLDDVLVGAWEGLMTHRSVACPVCRRGTLRPRYAAATGAPSGGRCDRCDTTLA